MSVAKIYSPAKNVMQSGKHGLGTWLLEYEAAAPKVPDPIMGWAGSGDTMSQLKLRFDSQDEAEAYAKSKGIAYRVVQPQQSRMHIKAYADNFR